MPELFISISHAAVLIKINRNIQLYLFIFEIFGIFSELAFWIDCKNGILQSAVK